MVDQGTMKMYPRGFLGATLGARFQTAQRLVENANGWSAMQVRTLRDQNTFDAYNPTVEELYNQCIKEHANWSDFHYRRRILLAALSAFGTLSFDVWVLAQYKSPSAGDLHGRFIVDTLQFIRTGRRDVALETWNTLLLMPRGADQIGPIPQEVREFFGLGPGGLPQWNRKLTDIIAQWCSQPNGLQDLLGTLHVLFGDLTE